MKKAAREIERLAATLGIESPLVVERQPHGRLTGTVDGRPISVVITMTKALSTQRTWRATKCNIRRAIREMRT